MSRKVIPSRSARPAGRPSRRSVFDDQRALAGWVSRIYTLERRLHESAITGQPSSYVPSPSLDGRMATLEAAPRSLTWTKIAHVLTREQIGPIDYLARQFDQYQSLAEPLYPNKLLGDEAWKRYADSRATKRSELETRLRSSRSALSNQGGSSAYVLWPPRESRDTTVEGWLSVLYCDAGLSPLFVYSVAASVTHNYPAYRDDAEKLLRGSELAAAVEYIRFRRDHDVAWEELIPRGFRTRAEGIYRELLTGLF